MTLATPVPPQRYTTHHKQSFSPAPQHGRLDQDPANPAITALSGRKGVEQREIHDGGKRSEAVSGYTLGTKLKTPSPTLDVLADPSSCADCALSGRTQAGGSRAEALDEAAGEDAIQHTCNPPPNHPLDPEKQPYTGCQISSEVTYLTLSNNSEDTLQYGSRDLTGRKADDVEGPLKMTLVYLSILSPCVTIFISIYSFLALITLLITDPIRFCTFRKPLSKLVSQALLPPIRFELHMIDSFCPTTPQPRTLKLILICITSPMYAVAISLAAWVAGVFWFFAGILGEPNPSGQRDNDGRAAGLQVRAWWERWLQKAVGL